MNGVTFFVPEKTMTALVGESGSGKTTVTNLLLRFYDVQGGSITLGGTDIRDIPYDELLDRISIVMQNVQLFDNTIEENIRVGKKEATKEEIIEAAKKAKIHDFIMSLPKGYETDIGENGGLLSGGQRQRISIARAFLKDAPILILDEMTSNVDPVNESLIQDAITELAKNRTVIVIAHHLRTIQKADQILVFQKGKLIEKGKHDELLEKCIEKGILKEYLQRKSREVINMLVVEYDYDTDIAVQRAEERQIAFADGSYQTKLETAKLMKGMNYPINDICTISGLSKEEIEQL